MEEKPVERRKLLNKREMTDGQKNIKSGSRCSSQYL